MNHSMTSTAKLTYEDYVKIPEDGRRHEIIDGEHIVSPAPILRHQRAVGRIHADLLGLEAVIDASVFISPVDVHLGRHDVMQPDVLAVANAHRDILTEAKIDGPPDFAIEVISPSTKHTDFGRKRVAYAKYGVREYWIVDIDSGELTVNILRDGGYETHVHCEVPVTSHVFPEFTLDWPALLASLAPAK
jgi:Uma2 family endonuclease